MLTPTNHLLQGYGANDMVTDQCEIRIWNHSLAYLLTRYPLRFPGKWMDGKYRFLHSYRRELTGGNTCKWGCQTWWHTENVSVWRVSLVCSMPILLSFLKRPWLLINRDIALVKRQNYCMLMQKVGSSSHARTFGVALLAQISTCGSEIVEGFDLHSG
jgi:hypothetical protein